MSRMDRTSISLPNEGHYFGLENFGDTDCCNCILQALYFCKPFREAILQYAQSIENRTEHEDNIYTSLADLFNQIHHHRKKSGVISPKRFVNRLKQDNEEFRKSMCQDANEFLIYLFLQISEILEKELKSNHTRHHSHEVNVPGVSSNEAKIGSNTKTGEQGSESTWIEEIFEGKLVHETKCLQCETLTSREEVFMELQLPVTPHADNFDDTLGFSAKTVLDKQDKYFCEVCQCHQESQRQIRIKQLPQILICHLLRYDASFRKLMDRVVFPMELKLCNTTDDTPACDDMYSLVAVVVHLGCELAGHFLSLVRSHGHWILFDDDHVEAVSETWVENTFGSPQIHSKKKESAYILFYERIVKRDSRING